jgi:DNA-binding transcriptional LysR family regulator
MSSRTWIKGTMDWTHRLRLRQLQVLLSLTQTQNISHSAKQLHMTQPALSKWLKDLEADIGLPLFERHARGLRPTTYGRTLIEFSTRIGNELDRARDEMTALRDGSSGRAVIGASGAVIGSVVPKAVLTLLAAMPNASVEVVEGPMDRLFQQLAEREIDVAIGRRSAKYHDPDVVSETLYEERLQFAVRPKHPLAARRSLQWSDLLAQRWVVWTPDIPVRHLLESALSAAGFTIPRGSVQSNSLLATIALVVDSNMVAVFSEGTIELRDVTTTLRRLPFRLETQNAVTMYWRKDVASLTAVENLLHALRATARQPVKG